MSFLCGGLCMCLQRLKVGVRSLAAGVAGGCKSPGKPNCIHLQEHYAVLTTEPPLQLPPTHYISFFSFFLFY